MIGRDLLDVVRERSTSSDSRIHGEAHWRSVAAAALCLLDGVPQPGADPEIVLLFALLHDAARRSDGRDPHHGERGAELAQELRGAGVFTLDDERMALLGEAIADHEKGRTHDNPTIGVCWDADRLNLWRVGRKPGPARLSTEAARSLASFRRSGYFAGLGPRCGWRALFLNFDARRRSLGGGLGELGYLRFGDLPPDGRSAVPAVSRMIGLREVGVSVYPAVERRTPGSPCKDYTLDLGRLVRGPSPGTNAYLGGLLREGRPLFALCGRQVGWGGAGEPVLDEARIVREVPPDARLRVEPYSFSTASYLRLWRQRREEAIA